MPLRASTYNPASVFSSVVLLFAAPNPVSP
jgi:hypothetical protein